MTKKAYIGIDGVAKKIKSGYIGVDNVAKKIKKAYIGVGGVARPCWDSNGGTLSYYGTITPLSVARYNLAAATVGDYAIFAGGRNSSSGYKNTVDAYDKSLTRKIITTLSIAKSHLAATSINKYAIFAGGGAVSNLSYSNKIDIYDVSLTRTSPGDSLSAARSNLSTASLNNHAIFAGGIDGYITENNNKKRATCSSVVETYDESLARSILSDGLKQGRYDLGAATVGEHALFVCGADGYRDYTIIDTYNTSFTHSTKDFGCIASGNVAASLENYALFASGKRYHITESEQDAPHKGLVDAYDKSLTKTSAPPLSIERFSLASTTIGNYALFGGGYSPLSNTVDVYDTSLTTTVTTPLSDSRDGLAATTVGNYAIFAGGYAKDTPSSAVDVYQMI